MISSQAKSGASASPAKGRKRRKSRASGSRARKKQRRLDAIFDSPPPPTPNNPSSPHVLAEDAPVESDDPALLRRSSRVRRVPAVLDSSPVPSNRKRPQLGEPTVQTAGSRIGKRMRWRRKKNGGSLAKKSISFQEEGDRPPPETGVLEEEAGEWVSRLRSRVRKGTGDAQSPVGKRGPFRKSERYEMEEKQPSKRMGQEVEGLDSQVSESRSRRRKRRRRRRRTREALKEEDQAARLLNADREGSCERAPPQEEIAASSSIDKECSDEKASREQESKAAADSGVDKECVQHEDLRSTEQTFEQQEEGKSIDASGGNSISDNPTSKNTILSAHQPENGGFRNHLGAFAGEPNKTILENEEISKEENLKETIPNDASDKPRVREGRRCGLCGGGSDGKPPKRLVRESADSDHEAYDGLSTSEEMNYDVWDGFGDEPEWLGRILGPIHDRFGIARVWVHQHCAVWSPEVYFAGLGCLKNVRAALYRGRALKCSRCGRPGATIGCRVDRCPKTYHLPCARADGCIFDHRKFLIACTDHKHLFQRQGNHYLRQIKKMKAGKIKLDMRKVSSDAWRKDLEAEEKWLENCGEDEEFLKREGKRLHRDILRISPVYIGGGSENDNLYQGWESVAGLQDVIRCMKEVVILPLLYPEFFSNLGLTPPRGVLLHGYPGTGKTLVVRALIGACSRGDKRIAYFARKGADCLGKYVGDAERQLRLLFQVAEKSQPSIIFFDEIDGLAPIRSRQQDQTHSSVVSTLLSLLDGLKSRGSVIVIGATNRPEAIDPALRRPGRFDREIYFPLPSVKDRAAILSLHTRSWPKPISKPVLTWIANQTVGYAGADLQALCTQAAMIALKRNCALHKLLSSCTRGSDHGRHPLPSFSVEERDWLAALAFAPPPCSRREAGMAASEVVSSPLQTHLIPCLLESLLHLLISLYLDERIWLPPALFKASKSIINVINSALEQKRIPLVLWRSHLHNLIQEPDVANEIESNLSCCGLLISPSSFVRSCMLDDDDGDHDNFDSYRLSPDNRACSISMQNLPIGWGKSSGFRVLIAGTPRSGQQHLATCLLFGFVGHIEIQKVNLATISQEGHGDLIRGITQILLKCLGVGRCVVYMPRIDLWAVDETCQQDTEESGSCPKTCKSALGGFNNATKTASQAWNSFVEQVDSVGTSASLIILATCEVQNHDLPLGIRQFFTSNVLNSTDSAPLECTIPRYLVQVDENFNHDRVINYSAVKLSHDLIQQYVQLLHYQAHMGPVHEEIKVSDTMKENSEVKSQAIINKETVELVDTEIDSERIASNCGASCRDKDTEHHINGDNRWSQPFTIRGHKVVDVQQHCHQDSFLRIPPNKIVRGRIVETIATLGYQILLYPHFAELCWATSKLKEGPYADINGPWKGWPFNSCVMHTSISHDKVAGILNSSNFKDREHSGVVRGLIAVGLLAYNGVYTSVREVSFEVRKVLELLVGQISTKILCGKDRYRFLRLLSQVAYLEDMVNSWAYTFHSLQLDGQMSASNSRPVIVERLDTVNHRNDSNQLEDDECMPNVSDKSCHEVLESVQKQGLQNFTTMNDECVNQSSILIPEAVPSQEMCSSAPLPPSLHDGSSGVLPSGEEPCRSGSPVSCSPGKISESPKQTKGLATTETASPVGVNLSNADKSSFIIDCGSGEVSEKCNGMDAVLSSSSGGFIPVEPNGDNDSGLRKNSNIYGFPETSCLYNCCSECLHVIRVLTHEILMDSWKSSGRCLTVDDLHDVVASCSASLLAATRKCYVSQSMNNYEEHSGKEKDATQTEDCACQDIGDIQLKKISFQHKPSKSVELLAMECNCHLRKKEVTSTANTDMASPFRQVLKFFFRDGALVPSHPHEDVVLHCKIENLCVCSIIEMILMIKQPSH